MKSLDVHCLLTFFDVETTGKADFKRPPADPCQPRVVQLAAAMVHYDPHVLSGPVWKVVSEFSVLIQPDGFEIPEEAEEIHWISTEKARERGVPVKVAMALFSHFAKASSHLVAYNIDFDRLLIKGEFARLEKPDPFTDADCHCAMKACTDICKIPGPYGFKWPKLAEAHQFFFGRDFDGAHDAMADVRATIAVHFETQSWIKTNADKESKS